MLLSFFSPLLLLQVAQCTHLRVIVPSTPALPNPATLPPSTTASLTTTSHLLNTPLRADNSFDFRNVSAGSYLLDIHSHSHLFAPLRVDVAHITEHHGSEGEKLPEVQVWGTFRGNEWENKGETVEVVELKTEDAGQTTVWAFAVRAGAKKEYLVERQGCEFILNFRIRGSIISTPFTNSCCFLVSPLNILKSPMILIALGSLVVVFGMPYMMDNSTFISNSYSIPNLLLSPITNFVVLVDPELRAEFEERQKSSPLGGGQAANPLQNFDAAAWLAGSSATKSESSGTRKSQAPVERGVTR